MYIGDKTFTRKPILCKYQYQKDKYKKAEKEFENMNTFNLFLLTFLQNRKMNECRIKIDKPKKE